MAAPSGPKSPIYVYYGAEDYNLDRVVRAAKRWPGRVLRVVSTGDGCTDQEVVDQLSMESEDLSPRTILVDEAQAVKESKSKTLRSYADDVRASDLSSVLIAIVRDSKLPSMWAHVASKGKSVECPKLKTFGKTNEVLKFIRERASDLGLVLETGVDEDLFKFSGGDLYRINSELGKVQILADTKKTSKVSRSMLFHVVAPALKVEPWEVAESAFAKNKLQAMNGLSILFRSSGEEALVPLVSALIRQIQKILMARHLVDSGSSSDTIASAIDMHPYRCKEFFLPVVRKHDSKALVQQMNRLCKLDRDVKSSSRSKRTLVELAVLSIAE